MLHSEDENYSKHIVHEINKYLEVTWMITQKPIIRISKIVQFPV